LLKLDTAVGLPLTFVHATELADAALPVQEPAVATVCDAMLPLWIISLHALNPPPQTSLNHQRLVAAPLTICQPYLFVPFV
jgi:MinD superfamily P-loop ATPase